MNVSTINVFQRLARQWDQVHPYNAAQILKIRGNGDVQALQNAWHDALNDLGLGRVRFDGGAYGYERLNGELRQYGVQRAPAGTTLEDWVSQQLNRRFDNPGEPPFRPFFIAGDGHYHAGVIYHHWVADSVSIRTVLEEWFVRLYDPARSRRIPVRLADCGYREFFRLSRGVAAVGHGLLSSARWASGFRRVRRVVVPPQTDLNVRWAVRTAPPGTLGPLHAAARARHCTLNDVFMAAIARACDRHVPLKQRPHRKGLALGAIVDLRPYFGRELSDAFGLFLGFTNVICKPRDLEDVHRLVAAIARQNRQQKRLGIPQTSAMRMLAGVAAGRMISADRMVDFYQKHLPLAGGISNVNMNRSWATRYHPDPLMDYIRVSPTGPMMPLVFATTTLGEQFHFALTYRPSVVPPERIDAIAETFVQFINEFQKPT